MLASWLRLRQKKLADQMSTSKWRMCPVKLMDRADMFSKACSVSRLASLHSCRHVFEKLAMFTDNPK